MDEFNKTNNEANSNGEGFVVDTKAEVKNPPETIAKTVVEEIFDWFEVILTAVVSVVVIFAFIFRVATIDGPSMNNTLFNGDKVIITNLGYKAKQGDIVVISRNEKNSTEDIQATQLPIIKRVIATEGDTVDIDFEEGVVYVNGKALDEPYIAEPTYRKFDVSFPVTVPEGSIFVLGDNRNDSMDSRDKRIGNDGMIDERYILGHAILRVFPFDKVGGLSNE